MPQYNSALGLVHFAVKFMDSIADTRFADLLAEDSFYDPRLELQNLWLQYQGCQGDATRENILSAQIRHTSGTSVSADPVALLPHLRVGLF